jgi:hypothetical protein
MNIAVKRSLLALAVLCTSLCIVACSSDSCPDIVVDDTIFFYKLEKEYGAALGKKTVYILYGKYKGMKAGRCITLGEMKPVHTFSIAEMLRKNQVLINPQSLDAAKRQQIEFKKRKSSLYDPGLVL